ncbi:MAG: hypothetical protein ACFCUL_05135 [Flavobacteriaceae bacterium]
MIDTITSKLPARSKFGLPYHTRRASIASCSTHVFGSFSVMNKDVPNAAAISFGFVAAGPQQRILVGELNFHTMESYLDGKSKIDGAPNLLNTLRKPQINK